MSTCLSELAMSLHRLGTYVTFSQFKLKQNIAITDTSITQYMRAKKRI